MKSKEDKAKYNRERQQAKRAGTWKPTRRVGREEDERRALARALAPIKKAERERKKAEEQANKGPRGRPLSSEKNRKFRIMRWAAIKKNARKHGTDAAMRTATWVTANFHYR